jgi:hypothetical protein
MAAKKQLQEKKWFVEDPEGVSTDDEKNSQLAKLLDGLWNNLASVSIRRIEIGSTPGWELTYRQ